MGECIVYRKRIERACGSMSAARSRNSPPAPPSNEFGRKEAKSKAIIVPSDFSTAQRRPVPSSLTARRTALLLPLTLYRAAPQRALSTPACSRPTVASEKPVKKQGRPDNKPRPYATRGRQRTQPRKRRVAKSEVFVGAAYRKRRDPSSGNHHLDVGGGHVRWIQERRRRRLWEGALLFIVVVAVDRHALRRSRLRRRPEDSRRLGVGKVEGAARKLLQVRKERFERVKTVGCLTQGGDLRSVWVEQQGTSDRESVRDRGAQMAGSRPCTSSATCTK